jgi:nicotinate-nucleotide adenylyltransferase
MKNVAVFGGSFDPPHLGHVMVVAHLLLNDASIDQILIVPCYEQTGKKLTSFFPRFKMCRLAFEYELPKVHVSPMEHLLGGESITLRTMKHIKGKNPDWNLRFVMGSDLLDKAPTWEGWEELVKIAPPLVVGRAGITPPKGIEGSSPICPLVSSTIVRAALEAKDYKSIERFLPTSVLEYIQRCKLYTADSDYG